MKEKVKIKISKKTIEKLRNKILSAYQIPEEFLFPKYHFGEAFSLEGKELDIFAKSVYLNSRKDKQ
jgi:hypothetical protein